MALVLPDAAHDRRYSPDAYVMIRNARVTRIGVAPDGGPGKHFRLHVDYQYRYLTGDGQPQAPFQEESVTIPLTDEQVAVLLGPIYEHLAAQMPGAQDA